MPMLSMGKQININTRLARTSQSFCLTLGVFCLVSSQAMAAIVATANNSTVTNPSGTTIVENATVGINSNGFNTLTLINNGTLTISNERGIRSAGANSTAINNGTINITAGIAGSFHGIDIQATNSTAYNNGTINTAVPGDGSGIRIANVIGGSAFNSGSINITNSGGDGIELLGSNQNAMNSGSISTSGSTSGGINTSGANANITNSGSISVTGSNSVAVAFTGANSTLTNSGLISATGSTNRAILGLGGTQTVNLQTGSQIIGSIDLGTGGADNDVFNVLGLPLGSSQMTLTNVETITLAAGLPGVVNGNSVTTVDPTGQSLQGTTLNHLTSSFHNVISQRMAQTKALPPIQLASLELAPGMLFQEREPIVWGEVFGSHRNRGNDGLALAYTHDYKGFTGGYEQDYHKARIGLMGGFADSSAATDTTSITTETDSFFGGAYGHWYLGPVNLTTTLSAGFEDHDNERTVIDNLAGTETARSDFTSVFFSPSLTLSSAYTINEMFELRPSATLTYNVAWYDSYTESGTTRSNLTIDNRSSQTLNGRVQLAVAMALNDTSEFELRSGLDTRHTFDGDTNASLSGASFSYASAGDDSVYGGYVGGNLRFNTTDRLDVIADVEYREASGDEDEIAARLRFEYRF